jgi:hypothetical protein
MVKEACVTVAGEPLIHVFVAVAKLEAKPMLSLKAKIDSTRSVPANRRVKDFGIIGFSI